MNCNRTFEPGELAFASQQGAYEIFYPCPERRILIINFCEAEQMPWRNFDGKRAYKVPTESIREKDRYNNDSNFMVVWK